MKQEATHIVGLGASAGGIQALKAFFSQVRDKPDMAFVVVTHLSPNRESHLHDVLRYFTTLPVEVIKDGDPVRAGVVHVMPEHVILSIKDGRLRLLEVDPALRDRKPIDSFFNALAVDQEERAIGIVLSGVGDDGTLGMRAIKTHGGVTFAQVSDGNGLDHPQMPDSAIASGAVDFTLPAEQIPQKLLDLQKTAVALGPVLQGQKSQPAKGAQRRLQDEISQLLRNHSGRDFAGYKSQTFFRRVARRMQVTLTPTPEAYLELLRNDPAEVMALYRELLISVTDFFRDIDAFKALSTQVIPSLLAKRGANDMIRIWVPGCATGQEAYSLAMLIRENMDGLSVCPQVQIFGTDIDEPALTIARAASYPDILLKNVSDERKRRFFRQDGEIQIIVREIRDMCIFSAHSLTNDPPFSQMDLISCRNLLIYFGTELQQRAIPTFHYALKPGGFLFLGSSESLGQQDDLFTAIDKKHRIFQSVDLGNQGTRIPVPLAEFRNASLRFEQNPPSRGTTSYRMLQSAERQIIDRHSPAHVIVRRDGNIVFFSAHTRQYFDIPRGAPTRQLFDSLRRELRQGLRFAWRETLETGKPASRHMSLLNDNNVLNLTVVAEPLNNGDDSEQMFLIVFSPKYEMESRKDQVTPAPASQTDEAVSEATVRELQERLQSTIEEYETTIEELNTLNEELVSSNEEAQSTNEELQASKEEMQSLNEELSTVNVDLNDKIDKLAKANTDLRDLQDATGISIVFLDRSMMIRSFTPAAAELLNMRASDVGRPLTELAGSIKFPSLQSDIHKAFSKGSPVEHRLPSSRELGNFLIRSVPYSENGAITGVVVTFVDVSSLAELEEQRVMMIKQVAEREMQMQDRRLQELRQADARKVRFMAILAHDLRTPLVAMLGTFDLFREDTEKEARDRMLDRVKNEGHGMLRLIDDVLELARLGIGEARLRPEPIALAALLEQVGDLVRPSADRNGTEVLLEVDDVPMLIGDMMSLRRVLLNFATNAVKATRGGSVKLSAKLGAVGEGGHTVTFAATDTGSGITAEDILRLFEDFSRLEGDSPLGEGTGLGLAICRRLATAMGGEVGVESTPGTGSQFWMRLTLPEADNAVSIADDDLKYNNIDFLAGLRVLVAEDHDMIRQLTCANLARVGMQPTEAADGLIAVDLAEAEEFDLILMDLQMPRLDGDKAAARIRHGTGRSSGAQIFCVTAHQSPEIAMMLSEMTFDACLTKPLDIQRLAALVRGRQPAPITVSSLDEFDSEVLAQLSEIDGGTILTRSLKSFTAEIDKIRHELTSLIAKCDNVKAGRLVHRLVGFGDILGARRLSAELRKFEVLIYDGDIEAVEERLEWINDVMTKTQVELEQLIKEFNRKSSGINVGGSIRE
jgi:two-component system, chemotaxis family, CheB/CheR fusion protein